MKQRNKYFLMGFLTASIVTTTLNTDLIASTSKFLLTKLNYDFNGNTNKVQQSINYNGTIYAPVKFLAESSGQAYAYDKKTNTVYVGRSAKTGTMSDIFPKPYANTFANFANGNNEKIVLGGQEYEKGYKFLMMSEKSCDASFNLMGKYKTITGQVGIDDEYSTRSYDVSLEFYGDGKLLSTVELEVGCLPKGLNLDVKGIRKFSILCKPFGNCTQYCNIDFGNLIIK